MNKISLVPLGTVWKNKNFSAVQISIVNLNHFRLFLKTEKPHILRNTFELKFE